VRRVEAFRWLYFEHGANALRLTRNPMTRETREVRYVKEGSDDKGRGS